MGYRRGRRRGCQPTAGGRDSRHQGQSGVAGAPCTAGAGGRSVTEQRSIGVLLHPGEQEAIETGVARAQGRGFRVWTALSDPDATVAEHAEDTALLITVGGDGTFLYGARLAAPRGIPVIGVNRGRLGFLNDVELDALPQAISRFAAGDTTTQRRALLETVVGDANEHVLAINEIVVRARDVNVVRLRVDVDGDLLGGFEA